ncbi:peptide antibiotic transporter SbmA [Maritalea porphyrae]|uniref:peptide antibiotic transporter SbmA n=1 Tax=Maritalea porphyrae TaxID=880732 RepID=UPI0022AE9CB6|nr:peptide antibiotic transporter SbmA [Maritalea porphyrae]MCZ4272740.1 peptide antibiotic transporter SbmA [Maritalea porphyrae]
MFRSFFPMPKVFFGAAVIWTTICVTLWFTFGSQLQGVLSLDPVLTPNPGDDPAPFLDNQKVWLYQYILMATYGFCIPWFFIGRNKWYWWSVVGSASIFIIIYAQVQVGAYLNDWYGSFYNQIQQALSEPGSVSIEKFYGDLVPVVLILLPNIAVAVLVAFYTGHYIFRWRTAMNFYYMDHWQSVREVEGASQRIQEDTMRFATSVEDLGADLVGSLMTLAVFLPILWTLSQQVTELPLIGEVSASLVWVALVSAAFGTVLLAIVGIRLPGLEFNNQKVEAAYRKELVYGEDDPARAQPLEITNLFGEVRKNYFRLYFHYMYFNVARYVYLQGSLFIPLIALGPSIVSGAITFGLLQQVFNAFSKVEDSFRYLANSWTQIIRLMSVYQRLRKFEKAMPV